MGQQAELVAGWVGLAEPGGSMPMAQGERGRGGSEAMGQPTAWGAPECREAAGGAVAAGPAPTWSPPRPSACDEALRADVVTALRDCPGEVRALVFRVGLAEPQLEAFAEALATRLRVALGERYQVRRMNELKARDEAVRAMFNGRNRAEVLRRFKISKSLFYTILARKPRAM